jgi:hypothetical protein
MVSDNNNNLCPMFQLLNPGSVYKYVGDSYLFMFRTKDQSFDDYMISPPGRSRTPLAFGTVFTLISECSIMETSTEDTVVDGVPLKRFYWTAQVLSQNNQMGWIRELILHNGAPVNFDFEKLS